MVGRHIVLHKTLKDGNDLEEWMPTFKTCAMANDWNAKAKSKSPMQPFRGTSNGVLQRCLQIMKISIVKVLKKTFQCDGTCFVEKRKLEKSYRTLLLKKQTLLHHFIEGLPTEVARLICTSSEILVRMNILSTSTCTIILSRFYILTPMDYSPWSEREILAKLKS